MTYENSYIEFLENIILFLLAFLILFIFRNWYNLYKKRKFRKESRKLLIETNLLKSSISKQKNKLNRLQNIENSLNQKQLEFEKLKQTLEEYKKKFFSTISKTEEELARQKEQLDFQKKAYESYVNFKHVEANNTRLGAHFIKNIISQIYEDLEYTESNYKTVFGISYKRKNSQSKVPSIQAIKNIFKLLDYNVSAIHNENTTLSNEIFHIQIFLELIEYLRPNATITLNNTLELEQLNTVKIKPTLFFTFIENALKHGNLNDPKSFITIDIKEDKDNKLSYILLNSAEQKSSSIQKDLKGTSNFGLKSLNDLLKVFYPGSVLQCEALPNKQYSSKLIFTIN